MGFDKTDGIFSEVNIFLYRNTFRTPPYFSQTAPTFYIQMYRNTQAELIGLSLVISECRFIKINQK